MEFNTPEEALNAIIKACEFLGWTIAIPTENSQEDIKGLVIGEDEYVQKVLSKELAD
jgi:hypothetical protein